MGYIGNQITTVFPTSISVDSATIKDGVTVDTDTFKVDATNDLVGINTATPSNYYADDLVLTVPDEGGMTIVQGTSEQSYLAFADGTSGDARYRGYLSYDHGIDSLYLGTSANVGLKIDANGHITKPLQSAFSAHLSSTSSAFATDGSAVTVAFASERFDNNSDFASNTFTAPVTGKYLLGFHLRINYADSAATYYIPTLVTSNHSYRDIINPKFSSDPVYISMQLTVVADMDANDTAYVTIQQYGGSSQSQIDGGNDYTYFTGYLLG